MVKNKSTREAQTQKNLTIVRNLECVHGRLRGDAQVLRFAQDDNFFAIATLLDLRLA
jgi:hypothetical protein